MPAKTAVLGGTGECGKAVIEQLIKLQNKANIHLVARRTQIEELKKKYCEYLNNENSIKLTESLIDFEQICNETNNKEMLKNNPFDNCEKVFCCLGTTRASAGSAEKFIRIDKEYVVSTANLAKLAGTKQYHYVSSSGANKNSSFLYPKTKGQTQDELTKLNFETLKIYHPALLLCNRTESRPGEFLIRGLGNMFSKVTNAGTVSTTKVGKSIISKSLEENKSEKNVEYVNNGDIHAAASCFDKQFGK